MMPQFPAQTAISCHSKPMADGEMSMEQYFLDTRGRRRPGNTDYVPQHDDRLKVPQHEQRDSGKFTSQPISRATPKITEGGSRSAASGSRAGAQSLENKVVFSSTASKQQALI